MTRESRIYLIAVTTLIGGLLMACASESEPAPTVAAPQPAAAQVAAPTAAPVPTAAAASTLTATALPPTPTPTTPPQPSQPQTVVSYIFYFTYENVTVNVGSTVTWDNKDSYLHTATSGTHHAATGLWDSGALSLDEQFSFTFKQVGTFPYFCRIHHDMTATVTVVASGAPASGKSPITGVGTGCRRGC